MVSAPEVRQNRYVLSLNDTIDHSSLSSVGDVTESVPHSYCGSGASMLAMMSCHF